MNKTSPDLVLSFLPPSLTHVELGLYTTDFEGQLSVSNILFGCAVVEWSARKNMNLNQY